MDGNYFVYLFLKVFNNNKTDSMHSKKKRPTSSSKSLRLKTDGGSHVSQTEYKPTPSVNKLITKKYYQSAIQEEERHLAYLLTRFLSGIPKIIQDTGQRISYKSHSFYIFTAADNISLRTMRSPKWLFDGLLLIVFKPKRSLSLSRVYLIQLNTIFYPRTRLKRKNWLVE